MMMILKQYRSFEDFFTTRTHPFLEHHFNFIIKIKLLCAIHIPHCSRGWMAILLCSAFSEAVIE